MRSDWKTWLLEKFSEALTCKLWNKKIHAAVAYRNGAKLNYAHPSMVLSKISTIHLRDSHMKFTEKNKVNNTMWAKLGGLIGQKQQNIFH